MGWDKDIFHGSDTSQDSDNCDPTKLKDAMSVDKAVEETMTSAFVTVSHCGRRNSRSDRFESTPKIRQHFDACCICCIMLYYVVFNVFRFFFVFLWQMKSVPSDRCHCCLFSGMVGQKIWRSCQVPGVMSHSKDTWDTWDAKELPQLWSVWSLFVWFFSLCFCVQWNSMVKSRCVTMCLSFSRHASTAPFRRQGMIRMTGQSDDAHAQTNPQPIFCETY